MRYSILIAVFVSAASFADLQCLQGCIQTFQTEQQACMTKAPQEQMTCMQAAQTKVQQCAQACGNGEELEQLLSDAE